VHWQAFHFLGLVSVGLETLMFVEGTFRHFCAWQHGYFGERSRNVGLLNFFNFLIFHSLRRLCTWQYGHIGKSLGMSVYQVFSTFCFSFVLDYMPCRSNSTRKKSDEPDLRNSSFKSAKLIEINLSVTCNTRSNVCSGSFPVSGYR